MKFLPLIPALILTLSACGEREWPPKDQAEIDCTVEHTFKTEGQSTRGGVMVAPEDGGFRVYVPARMSGMNVSANCFWRDGKIVSFEFVE